MASLEFQPVPPGTSAWARRGSTFLVRLLGTEQGSLRETLADVAVPDPHDNVVKAVELSVLEYVILRACTLDEDAVDAEFHLCRDRNRAVTRRRRDESLRLRLHDGFIECPRSAR